MRPRKYNFKYSRQEQEEAGPRLKFWGRPRGDWRRHWGAGRQAAAGRPTATKLRGNPLLSGNLFFFKEKSSLTSFCFFLKAIIIWPYWKFINGYFYWFRWDEMALTLRLACLSVSWSASLTLQGDHNKLAEGTAIVINHGYAIFTLQIISKQHLTVDEYQTKNLTRGENQN